MMKKVLLTGAAGFIGRHTIPLMIESGHKDGELEKKLPGLTTENLYQLQEEMHKKQEEENKEEEVEEEKASI